VEAEVLGSAKTTTDALTSAPVTTGLFNFDPSIITEAALSRRTRLDELGDDGTADLDKVVADEEKQKNFGQKRAQHYDEYKKVMEMKARMKQMMDEEEDEE
jgi:hypothetical protein